MEDLDETDFLCNMRGVVNKRILRAHKPKKKPTGLLREGVKKNGFIWDFVPNYG